MDIKDYAQMMSYLTRPRDVVPEPRPMAQGERTNFVLGGAAITAMKATAKKITDDLDRLPTPNELVQATGKAAATIKNYFKMTEMIRSQKRERTMSF